MLALPYTTRKCERYQLRMRAISRSKHTKLKNTKIYSKGVLANHMKISTNENFPLSVVQFDFIIEQYKQAPHTNFE